MLEESSKLPSSNDLVCLATNVNFLSSFVETSLKVGEDDISLETLAMNDVSEAFEVHNNLKGEKFAGGREHNISSKHVICEENDQKKLKSLIVVLNKDKKMKDCERVMCLRRTLHDLSYEKRFFTNKSFLVYNFVHS